MAKTKDRIEEIKQRIIDLMQLTVGLPMLFRPSKKVGVPAPKVLGPKVECDSYRVEVVTPTGFGIDVGQVAFEPDSGNVFIVQPSVLLTALFDKVNPKDRF